MANQLAPFDAESLSRSLRLAELEKGLGQRVQVWLPTDDSWECHLGNACGDTDSCLSPELITHVLNSKLPLCSTCSPGKYLVVIPQPLPRSRDLCVLTTLVETESPHLLNYAIEQYLAAQQLALEVNRQNEETLCLLQQASDDYEGLSLLRSMAEQLSFDIQPQSHDEFVRQTLSLLGRVVGMEALYFLAGSHDGLAIQAEWHAPGIGIPAIVTSFVENLAQELAQEYIDSPIVRHDLDVGDVDFMIHGVSDLVFVPVSSQQVQIGWILAVNLSFSGHKMRFYQACGSGLNRDSINSRITSLLTTAATMLAFHAHNLSLVREREGLLLSVVRTLVSAIDSRDRYTCGHSERVALFAKRLAAALGLSPKSQDRMYLAGLLHDLGKIGVSDAVLNKEGPLTPEEFAEIKLHPQLGWNILHGIDQFDSILPGVLHHHERMDGKGYPAGLAEYEIPFDARLMAVVDAFDAMTSDRTYRRGMPVEKALELLVDGAGTQWDPEIVDTFMSILPDIEEIRVTYRGTDLAHWESIPKSLPYAKVQNPANTIGAANGNIKQAEEVYKWDLGLA
jgi:HD-GYP domain-containing protein (c-di-GMP phosphodiesterase class II)